MALFNGLRRGIVVLAVLLPACVAAPRVAEYPAQPAPEDAVQEVIRLINEARVAHGREPLTADPELMDAAGFHAEYMARHDCFEHRCPGGPNKRERLRQAGFKGFDATENIYAGRPDPAKVVAGWMGSPPHRVNMLAAVHKKIGVGYYYLASDGGRAPFRHYWVANFWDGTVYSDSPVLSYDPESRDPAEQAAAFIRLVNAARAERGIAALTPDAHLAAAARAQAEYMAERDCIGCPDEISVAASAVAAGYGSEDVTSSRLYGAGKPKHAVEALTRESDGIARSLLDPSFTSVGVGYVFLDKDEGEVRSRHYWQVVLGKPPESAPAR